MSATFDPYRKWLGIPEGEQPPNHYRLLGIALFESDPDVISHAADRQMGHIRTFQAGKHGPLSQKLLNELSAARVCLLNSEKKAAYDEKLDQEQASSALSPPIPPPKPKREKKGKAGRKRRVSSDVPSESGPEADQATESLGLPGLPKGPVWAGVAVVLLLTGGAIYLASTRPDRPAEVAAVGEPEVPSESNIDEVSEPSEVVEEPDDDSAAEEDAGEESVVVGEVWPPSAEMPSPSETPGAFIEPDSTAAEPQEDPVPEPIEISPPVEPPPEVEVAEPTDPRESMELPSIRGLESRRPGTRKLLLEYYEGSEASEAAVERSLEWLIEHQHPDGYWSFDHRVPGKERGALDQGRLTKARNSATAMALLPLLGANRGAMRDEYRPQVFAGVLYLRKNLKPVGPGTASLYESTATGIPSHALGTIALCEASSAFPDKTTRAAAQAAVNFVVLSQNDDGGWGWRPKLKEKDRADSSNVFSFGWNVTALKTAQWVGIRVPDKTLERALVFLEARAIRRDGQVSFPYRVYEPNGRDDTTVMGLLSGIYLGWPADDNTLLTGIDRFQKSGPRLNGDFQTNYHATMILRDLGYPSWGNWNPVLRDFLIGSQYPSGIEAGSWYMQSGESIGSQTGRLYCTVFATLILEAYYRHPPLYGE